MTVESSSVAPIHASMGFSGGRRVLAVALAALVGGYLASSLGYVIVLRPAGVVFLWPPSGLVLAALILTQRRDWPAILVGALIGNFLADAQHGATPGLALAGAAANACEQLLAVTVIHVLGGQRMAFGRLRDVGVLILGAAVVSNAVTALGGALVLKAYGSPSFWRAWFNWWSGDGMGMLVLTPVVLTVTDLIRRRPRVSPGTVVEAVAILAAIALLAGALLRPNEAVVRELGGHAYLVFPLLIWAGIRLGPAGAAAATLVLTAQTVWAALHGGLPFASALGTQFAQLLQLYTYLALAGLSSLLPAAVLAERAASLRRLEESENRFRELADHISEAFFIVDMRSRQTLYVNPGWAAIWGRPIEQGYDPEVWFDAIVPEDRGAMLAAMEANAAGQPTLTTFRITRPDGAVRWLRGQSIPVRDAAGVVQRLVGVTTDITDLRESEMRFVQAQKMEAVGRLAGGVAHDFNNLLTVILAEADEIARTADRPQTRGSAEEIQRAGNSATALTRQLLAFSRRQIIEPVVFNVRDAVDSTSRMLRRLIGEHIRLDMRGSKEPVWVRADRGQFEQLLSNLAVNARDAMPRGGMLTVSVGSRAADSQDAVAAGPSTGWVAIAVADTGTGMSDDVLQHAFEPFFTTKEQGRGTGLGLATCHTIVTSAGGRIEITSELGRGTTVEVLLPQVEPGEAPEAATVGEPPRGRERILLVEDESAVRRVTARLLRGQGYEVLEARDADDAMQQLQLAVAPVDLLMTDVILPGRGGRELAGLVRAALPSVKVLFVTGYTDDDILQGMWASHDVDVLQKPFSADGLARHVRDVLDKRES